MSISPSVSPRQCPDRCTFRACRSLPDKKFRYLRAVIVTAAVHRGFGRRLLCHQVTNFLELPALGRHQPLYMSSRLGRCDPLCEEAPLLPKLRGYFAKFLRESYLATLGILHLPTCVGFRYSLLCPSRPTNGSTGIFTCCLSTMPFGLILGPDSPSMDEPCGGTLSFGRSFSLVHLRHKSARSVSYYVLFQGWLLLGKPPGCLCTPTSFITERSFRGLMLYPKCPVNCCASTHFRENQLALGSNGISPLTITYPLILQHQLVRTST
ncbi:hypothetical protein CDL12_09352 [Handroanthus impetiginosus]|uniref:Uncharacterized protein n=1 Tax=Handroanthus impetiginosus TaxID=429701 RepID=A0A2G9HKC1_9LAMI|nr:hypothetical protein CDL12_09352 [Handroanthus impetiginosus]